MVILSQNLKIATHAHSPLEIELKHRMHRLNERYRKLDLLPWLIIAPGFCGLDVLSVWECADAPVARHPISGDILELGLGETADMDCFRAANEYERSDQFMAALFAEFKAVIDLIIGLSPRLLILAQGLQPGREPLTRRAPSPLTYFHFFIGSKNPEKIQLLGGEKNVLDLYRTLRDMKRHVQIIHTALIKQQSLRLTQLTTYNGFWIPQPPDSVGPERYYSTATADRQGTPKYRDYGLDALLLLIQDMRQALSEVDAAMRSGRSDKII